MAIAFDNKTSAISATDNVSSLTYSHTITSNTNGLLFVSVAAPGGVTVSGVTYAAVAMTLIRSDVDSTNTDTRNTIFYLVAPASGSNNVVVTLSGATGLTNYCVSGAISLTGVDQTLPLDAQSGNNSNGVTGTNATATIQTVYDNAWILIGTNVPDGSKTWTSLETLRWTTGAGVGNAPTGGGMSLGPKTPSGDQNLSESYGAPARKWALSAASFVPAGRPGSYLLYAGAP